MTTKQSQTSKWIYLFCLVAVLLVPLLVLDKAQAGAPIPIEGQFTAPDITSADVTALANAAKTASPGYYQTSEYMIGSVAVGLILPESDGTVDSELNDWSAEQRQRVLGEVRAGLQWWAQQASADALTFVIDDNAPVLIDTGYEPITHPQFEEGLWIDDVLSGLGYDGLSYWTKVRDYVNDLRETYQTDWAFVIFVINSTGDGDGAFSNGYFAYAYVGGPFFVMTYSNAGYGIDFMEAVTAHEAGHVFRALDQYRNAHVACTTRSGYLAIETQNSQQQDCISDVSSIMRGGVFPYSADSIDPYARGQVGWIDSDGDGLYDPIDTDPVLTATLNSQTGSVWSVSGQVFDIAFPSSTRPATTINSVLAEYNIDGGAWHSATPDDGEFDSPEETYAFQLDLTASGNHHIFIRARNNVDNLSDVTRFIAVVPDPVDGGLDTWIDPASAAASNSDEQILLQGIASSYNADGTPSAAVTRVEYRVDAGAWQTAQPQDSAFDGAEEGFIILLDLLGGDHLIEARASDAQGKVEYHVASILVSVDYHVFLPSLMEAAVR